MRTIKRTPIAAFGFIAIATLSLSACSSGSTTTTAASGAVAASQAPMAASTPSASASASAMMDPTADLVGPGCAGYASTVPSGAGSVKGMAQDPVAVAASNNPLLKTLTAAVSQS